MTEGVALLKRVCSIKGRSKILGLVLQKVNLVLSIPQNQGDCKKKGF